MADTEDSRQVNCNVVYYNPRMVMVAGFKINKEGAVYRFFLTCIIRDRSFLYNSNIRNSEKEG